jgi:chorismate mutase
MNKKVKLTQKNKKKNIDRIRKNIDNIDTQILKLLSFRRKEVLQITKCKKRSEIVDKKRIAVMLKRLILKGKNLKIESYVIANVWKAMIKSFIKLEKEKI